jgi:hypothetical protein
MRTPTGDHIASSHASAWREVRSRQPSRAGHSGLADTATAFRALETLRCGALVDREVDPALCYWYRLKLLTYAPAVVIHLYIFVLVI